MDLPFRQLVKSYQVFLEERCLKLAIAIEGMYLSSFAA